MASVIIPIGALLIAILSVAALWLWWTGDSPAELAPEQGGSSTLTEGFSSSVAGINASPVQTSQPQTLDEIMRVVRGNDGQLHIMINGTTYRSMADISRDTSSHDQFMNTLRSLSQFAQEAGGVLAAPPSFSAPPAARPVEAQTAATAATASNEIVEADPNSMAAQIERFLQDRLARTPGMMTRSIHIYSTPSGGLQIKVDSTLYETVGDVDEPEARGIIEAAIRDWEASLSV